MYHFCESVTLLRKSITIYIKNGLETTRLKTLETAVNFKASTLEFSGNSVSPGFPRWQCVLRNRCLRPKILVLSFLFSQVN